MDKKKEDDCDVPKYLPKTRTGQISSQFEYVLRAQVYTRLVLGPDGKTATIAGLIAHVSEFDEAGYHPPKAFVNDGLLEDRVDELLDSMGLKNQWEFNAFYSDSPDHSFTIDPVYVFDTEPKGAVTHVELRSHKLSWLEATLRKKRHKRAMVDHDGTLPKTPKTSS
jgi:hypothetical protein